MERLLIQIGYGYTNRPKLTRIDTDDKENIWYMDEKDARFHTQRPNIWDDISVVRYDEKDDAVLSCRAKMVATNTAQLLHETLNSSKEDYRA